MTVKYTNWKRQTYYLHQGQTKTGKPKYHFSIKDQGNLVDQIPDGYEIYEHPSNGQVFLRKKILRVISEIEEHTIKKHLAKIKGSRSYKIDIKGKIITIFEANQNPDELRKRISGLLSSDLLKRGPTSEFALDTIIASALHFQPVLRFTLEDAKTRLFIAERFCFLGGIDDWMLLGESGSLDTLAKEFIQHLGKESFFELD